jgi:hypothetical protein
VDCSSNAKFTDSQLSVFSFSFFILIFHSHFSFSFFIFVLVFVHFIFCSTMKPLTIVVGRIFALLALVCILYPASMLAQEGAWTTGNRLMIHGGISSPVANFSAIPSTIGDFIPQNGKTPPGVATMGFNLGISDIFRFTPNLGLIATLDANYNPINTAEAERQLRAGVGNININGTSIGVLQSLLQINTAYSAQAYINGTLMGGIRYDLPLLVGVLNAYATAQVGLLYGFVPQREAKLGVSIPFVNVNANATVLQPAASAAAFAYSVGAGVLIGDRVNIGLRYLSASPEYSNDVKTSIQSNGLQGNVSVPLLGTVNTQTLVNSLFGIIPNGAARYSFPTNLLQVTVGIVF